MVAPRLEELLAQDGVKLKRAGRDNYLALCPFHQESNPSFSVNLAKQLYKCHAGGCGEKGDTVTYLVKARGMSMRDAVRLVKGETDMEIPKGQHRRRAVAPVTGDEPPPKPRPKLPDNHQGRYPYYSFDGGKKKLRFVVQKYVIDGRKVFGQYAPIRLPDGKVGWVNANPMEEGRPLYRLEQVLAAPPEQQIMLSEGEKCVHAILAAFKGAVATTWAGGSQAVNQTDFSTLAGRPVLILPDFDTGGLKAGAWLAEQLHGLGCQVRIMDPPSTMEIPEKHGEDIADWIAAMGAQGAMGYVKPHIRTWQPPAAETPPDDAPVPDSGANGPEPPPVLSEEEYGGGGGGGDPAEIAKNGWYEILGNVHLNIAIKLWTQQIVEYSRTQVQRPDYLLSLAPNEGWWRQFFQFDDFSAKVARQFGQRIIRVADEKGQIDTNRVRERGACIDDDGHVMWHLGDRVLHQGSEVSLHEFEDLNMYVSGPAIDIGRAGDGLLREQERADLMDMLLRYRWKTDDDAKTLLGWMVASMLGGALPWRPHVWMPGQSESGKSWMLKNVLLPVQETMAVRVASVTEASLAYRIGSASLPVVIEEAEPENPHIGAVIELARIAAGREGERTRARAGGGFMSVSPGFSALMISTKLPRLVAADRSRFAVCRMAEVGIADWPALEKDILDKFGSGSDVPRRLRRTIVYEADEIAKVAANTIRDLERQGVSSRISHIAGTLNACWGWLSGDDALFSIVTPGDDDRRSDASNVLNEILFHRVRKSGSMDDVTLFDLLIADERSDQAASYGLRYTAGGLDVSYTHPSLGRILARTRWATVDLQQLLMQIPGAAENPGRPRLSNGYRGRSINIPPSACADMGLDLPMTPSEQTQGAFV